MAVVVLVVAAAVTSVAVTSTLSTSENHLSLLVVCCSRLTEWADLQIKEFTDELTAAIRIEGVAIGMEEAWGG